jgi:hypothetical protein
MNGPSSREIHIHKRSRLTAAAIIPNALAQDRRLTWAARGLHVYLLSLPEHWVIREALLEQESPKNLHHLRTIVKELIGLGYIVKTQSRLASGRMGPAVWEVWDTPREPATVDRFSVDGFSADGLSADGKPDSIERELNPERELRPEKTPLSAPQPPRRPDPRTPAAPPTDSRDPDRAIRPDEQAPIATALGHAPRGARSEPCTGHQQPPPGQEPLPGDQRRRIQTELPLEATSPCQPAEPAPFTTGHLQPEEPRVPLPRPAASQSLLPQEQASTLFSGQGQPETPERPLPGAPEAKLAKPRRKPSSATAIFEATHDDVPMDLDGAAAEILGFWAAKGGKRTLRAWETLLAELRKIRDAAGDLNDPAVGLAVVADQLNMGIQAGWKSVVFSNYQRYGGSAQNRSRNPDSRYIPELHGARPTRSEVATAHFLRHVETGEPWLPPTEQL